MTNVEPDEVLQVGVVGGGLVAQVVHLPLLCELDDRFAVAALADPSERVRDGLARRHGIPRTHRDHREMFEAGGIDVVVVASPNGTHAEVVLDALGAGLHVLVEKPLCITLADVDRIAAARRAARRVVQVGYMKRFDPAYEALLADLAVSADPPEFVQSITHDPGLARFFAPACMIAGDDVPARVGRELRRSMAQQVGEAAGTDDPALARVFSESFLGALVHDVNLVHGALGAVGESPALALHGGAWSDGRGVSGVALLPAGGEWTMAWLLVPGAHSFSERVSIISPGAIRTLSFPAPYLRNAPARYELETGTDALRVTRGVSSYRGSYERQLVHFHDAVTSRAPARNAPEEARADIDLLTRLFADVVARAAPARSSGRALRPR